MRTLLKAMLVALPWPIRRVMLMRFLGYEIDPTARIGFAWVYPDQLVLAPHASIGHLTVCKGLARLELGEHASIGRANWITGFPRTNSSHFAQQSGRVPELVVGPHSAITHRHLIDATERIVIGSFTTVAGY